MFTWWSKGPIEISRQAKLFDCIVISYVMGLDLPIILIVSLCFTPIVIILTMGGKGGSFLRCCTRTCEYNYNLKLCTFNVGESEKIRGIRHASVWVPWGTFSNLTVSKMYLQALHWFIQNLFNIPFHQNVWTSKFFETSAKMASN